MIPVAAYCRVSTDREDQQNSFLSQQRFFQEYITQNPDWRLHQIYADEGITGTNTKKRTAFHAMIADAHQGKFQLILTKEVSRFSRNIVDTLRYTRELKTIGVNVRFLTENIDTSDPKSEMLLSFMATLAQEESRRTGTRVTWGQQRQMEKGVVFGHSLLGYDVLDGKLHINPEGAELVRLIFQKYTIEKMSTRKISVFLQEQGYRTLTGNPRWNESHIIKILNNEKYVGDLVQRKSFTPDYLTHQKKINHGELPLVIHKNHHAPIIDRALWEQTQAQLRKNNKHNGAADGHSNRYLFSGKIKCGVCGESFVGRTRYRKDGSCVRYWSCATVVRDGNARCCVGKMLRDDIAIHMIKTALLNLSFDKNKLAANVAGLAVQALQYGQIRAGESTDTLQYRLEQAQKKKIKMMDAFFAGDIAKLDMETLKTEYEEEIDSLRQRLNEAGKQPESKASLSKIQEVLSEFLRGEKESELLYKTVLDRITVFQDQRAELRLHHLPAIFHFALT